MTSSSDPEPDPLWKAAGSRLAEARIRAGLSQTDAAKAVRLGRAQTISDWEAGKYGISIQNLVLLCDLYSVALDWVLGRARTPKVAGTGGIIDLEVERAILSATTWSEVVAMADRLQARVRGGILFGYEIPSEIEVLSDKEWESRRDTIMMKLERLQHGGKTKRG